MAPLEPAADPNNYFFGEAHSINRLSDDLNKDPTIQNVLSGIAGGDGTKASFSMVDNFSSMLSALGKTGDVSGWNQAPMEDGTTAYYQKTTNGKDTYTVTIQAKNFNVNENGHILSNDTKTVIDGQTFNGIGHVAANMLINDSIITETLWVVGTCAAGDLAWLVVKAIVQGIIDKAAAQTAKSMGKLIKAPGGGLKIEDWAAAEEEAAGLEIQTKNGLRAFLKRVGSPGVIAGLIIVAAVTVILSLILHQSYHRVRLWNLTRYKLLWDSIYFDEGKFQESSPSNSKSSALGSVCSSAPFPGSKKVKQAHFGDYHVISDSLIHGIGWAARIKLVNPQND